MKEAAHDYVIIGGGIIGMAVARELKARLPGVQVAVIEKDKDVAMHASGRNSGVLHAGFYYTADSLKARFTRSGNRKMREFCREQQIPVHDCGKLVVAADESELEGLKELKRRAERNGVELHWVSEKEAEAIDPRVKTHGMALFSPTTATVDPVPVCTAMKRELIRQGVRFYFETSYRRPTPDGVLTNRGKIRAGYIINAAGLYADQIAHDYGFGLQYTILPFKGIYLKNDQTKHVFRTNIYPVPDLRMPFLGVHVTVGADGSSKIGPTAMPAFWRENYGGFHGFRWNETCRIAGLLVRLWLDDAFQFRRLAREEMKKYNRRHLLALAGRLVKEMDSGSYRKRGTPGIRAQLLDVRTLRLVQDFILEGDGSSMHILNAVSPAFTCSLSFAGHVVDLVLSKQKPGEAAR